MGGGCGWWFVITNAVVIDNARRIVVAPTRKKDCIVPGCSSIVDVVVEVGGIMLIFSIYEGRS